MFSRAPRAGRGKPPDTAVRPSHSSQTAPSPQSVLNLPRVSLSLHPYLSRTETFPPHQTQTENSYALLHATGSIFPPKPMRVRRQKIRLLIHPPQPLHRVNMRINLLNPLIRKRKHPFTTQALILAELKNQ